MSFLDFLNPFSDGFFGRTPTTQARKPLATEPQTSDPTQQQQTYGYGWYPHAAIGNTLINYPACPAGTWLTYRLMEETMPSLALGFCCKRASTIGAPFTIEADKGVPDEARELIERTYLKRPVLIPLLSAMMRSLALRSSSFAVIWGEEDGYQIPVQFKYLLPELTQTLLDDQNHGNIVGVMQNGEELTGPNYMLFLNEPEKKPIHGHSLLENVRAKVWWPWMEGIDRLNQLNKKAAGTVFSVLGPETQGAKLFTLPDQSKVDGVTAAQYIANQLSQGISLGGTHMAHKLQGMPTPAQLKTAHEDSQFTVEYYDMANVGPAVEALLNGLRMHDANGFRGIYLPERSAMEGQHGTKAEAGEHRSFVDAQTDLDRADLAACINQGPINWQLQFNFGPKLRDKVRLVPSPVVDDNLIFLRETIAAMLKAGLAGKVAQVLKMRGVFDQTGLPINNEMEAEIDDPEFWKGETPAMDQNGQPIKPMNGNGNGTPRTTDKRNVALSRIGRYLRGE